MSTTSTPRRRAAVAGLALATGATALALAPAAPARAAVTGTVTEGSASWATSEYLNAGSTGRPKPVPSGYVAPAAYDTTALVSTWGEPSGTVAADGSADLSFAGTAVHFAPTGGGWIRMADLEADLDDTGDGTLSALVSYGVSSTGNPGNRTYDPAQAPVNGPTRVDVVDLAGNTAADVESTPAETSWTGLDGAWSAELLDLLDGDADAGTPAFQYASTIVNDETKPDRAPAPLSLTVDTAAPEVEVSTTSTSAEGLELAVSGDGFRAVTNPGDAGVYVGLAPSGGLPDVSDPAGQDAFVAAQWVMPAQMSSGSFSTTLDAPADEIDPRQDYSVYTWQAHSHSNPSQDTETPVDIDMAALGYPTDSTTTLKVTKAPTTKKKGAARVTVAGDSFGPAGKVDLRMTKGGRSRTFTVKLAGGEAAVTLPAAGQGRWKLVADYRGNAVYAPSRDAVLFRVTR